MKQLYFQHREDLIAVWPDIQPDRGKGRSRGGIQPWWRAPQARRGTRIQHSPGHGKFFIRSPRNQQVIVKSMPVGTHGQSWYHHGAYLQDHGAKTVEELGLGFNGQENTIDIKTMVSQWQRKGDQHLFKIILSPGQDKEFDLKSFTRRVMREVERDLGKPLQWTAIEHHNTKHSHVHVMLRGKSKEQVLNISRMYLQGGIKERAQEVATNMVGPRTRQEMERGYEQALARNKWSQLDQSLKTKMSPNRMIESVRLSPFELRRMEQLTERGLAFREGSQWRMAINWEAKQMEGQERQPQPREQEQQAPDAQQPHEQKQEQERDEQHQRAVIVDELEQELGWGR